MQRKIIFALVLVLGVMLGFWLWPRASRPDTPEQHRENSAKSSQTNRPQSTAGPTSAQAAIPQPRLFKATRYPPETSEEKAMWAWWRAMDKADPKFQWKMPIEFFGKIVDQHEHPVEEATVTFTWTTVVGPLPDPQKRVLSDSAGRFELGGVQGKALVIRVAKEGYLPTRDAGGAFEYAAFFEDKFHVPNREHPVVFRLRKLTDAEPMLKFITNAEVGVGPTPVVLNAETGKLGSDGDVSFSLIAGAKGQYGPDFSITITAMSGAAFAFSDEEFMFEAPEAGYRSTVAFNKLASEPDYNRVQAFRFYVKTRSGKYAAVDGDITIREGLSDGKAGFHAIIYHNPSGSRNLEFDHRKWLNR